MWMNKWAQGIYGVPPQKPPAELGLQLSAPMEFLIVVLTSVADNDHRLL